MSERISVSGVFSKKERGERITVLTAYDYSLARLLDQAGIDIVLVGDSVANVVLGLEATTEVGMEVMLHHARAVARGVGRALVVADMPFEAYQKDILKAAPNAKRFLDDAGCQAVKVEWFDRCPDVVTSLREAGIEVMGHVGLTPQTVSGPDGFRVQGRDEGSAARIMAQAKALEKAGCFAVVLECVPEGLAEEMTRALKIPTIGIGAGVHCDGQVLVTYDLLNLYDRRTPKFVKKYADVSGVITKAVAQYKNEVEQGRFPGPEHTFH